MGRQIVGFAAVWDLIEMSATDASLAHPDPTGRPQNPFGGDNSSTTSSGWFYAS
jgi:hypothetical protein